LLLTTRHISINLITSSTAKMKSVVALSALAAAATAQRAGPVALVNPVQVALDGFSEDVNQDGFVDPIAPAVGPLGLGYGAALPLGGYGLGYGAGIWKRDAEPQWLAYGAPLNLAIPHGAFGAVLHPNGAVAPPYTADQQLALAEKNKILAERGQLPALPVAAALIKRDADSEAEADPQLLLGGGVLGAPALGLGGVLGAPALGLAAPGLLATGIAPTYTLGGAVVAPAIAAPAVEAAPVEAVEVAAPAIAAPAITYGLAAPAIAAPALAAPALTYAAAPAVAHVAVPTVQHVAYTQHIPVSKTYTQTIDLGVQRRVISSPLIAGLAGAPVVAAAAPVVAVAAEEAVAVEE